MFTCVLGRCVASTVSLIPNSFGKECPFSGVTNSGRVWRKVPESDARSVSEVTKTWGWLPDVQVEGLERVK